MLQIDSLYKKFDKKNQSSIHVLEDIHFSIAQGEIVALTGSSGSGKTTLLSLIAGLENPTSGRILFEGNNFSELGEKEKSRFRANNMGIIFQQFHLIPHFSSLENVMLPLEILGIPDPKKQATTILQDVGLGHRLEHTPSELSGGECQRVAIARALVAKPKLLLADEPSGNLDTKTGKKVMDLLFALVKEKQTTLLLVTHDLEIANQCKRQLSIQGGKIS